ncbi:hypothetical protein BDP27DRAFT_1361874 [Rhodocollybia butyracea]|uniref:Uncharacterized protein n=1 Tax=Rhodocollybia butyracea TaxID=206335 RepID=A0A9P5PY93_9AGAR|nr:hypothetical protein BDP27DRAFT_1361874 [Rhodocollybia butyracea]
MEKQLSITDDTALPQSTFTMEKQAYALGDKPFSSSSQQNMSPSKKQPLSSVGDRTLESLSDEQTAVIDPDELPEGGLDAWLAVIAVFLLTFVSLGTGSIWGVFQSAYAINPSSRFQQDSTLKIGYVGGCIRYSFADYTGCWDYSGCADAGINCEDLLGTFAFTGDYVRNWLFFHAGACAGAVILAPVVQSSIDHLGIPWALRILSFITLALGFTAICCIRKRAATKKIVQYRPFDPSLFKIPGYPLYLAFAFLQLFWASDPVVFYSELLYDDRNITC